MKISETRLVSKFNAKCKNAKERNIEFKLDHEDLRVLFERNPGYCDYTGLEFNTFRVPTIERIDDKQGYVPGNLCLACDQANQMKDVLLDKDSIQRFRVRKDALGIMDALRTKLTPEYLEHLKQKYRADTHYNPSTDMYKDYFKELTKEQVVSILSPNENKEEKIMSEQWSEEQKAANDIPEDVHLTAYYGGLAKASKTTGMEFKLTYAQFKAKFTAKTCRLSGKALSLENKFMLVLDKSKPFESANVMLVEESLGHNVMKFAESTGMTIDQIKKMFKKLA